jgi:hypothetical protein
VYSGKICGPFGENVTLTSIVEDFFDNSNEQIIKIIKYIFYNWWLIIFLTGLGLVYVKSLQNEIEIRFDKIKEDSVTY